MKIPFLLSMAALAVTLTGGALHEAQARGLGGVRGGVGGFGGGSIQARPATGGAGGFSRGGPAASGSFSGSAATSANRNQTAQTASANRAATRQSRQATTTVNQSQRQSTVQSTQSGYYGAGYRAPAAAGYYRPPAAAYAPAARAEYIDNNTVSNQEAAGLMLGTAAISYAAGKSRSTQTAAAPTSAGASGLPCTPNTKTVNGVVYYQCGANWYTQAYGSTGVMYMPVPPPQ